MRHKRKEMAISNAELAAMTKQMEELHNDESVPKLSLATSEWNETIRDAQAADPGSRYGATSRRHFILGAGGLAAAGGLLAACGSSPTSSAKRTSSTQSGAAKSTGSSKGSSLSSNDAKSMAVDASIENLAIFAYEAGISAVKANKLGSVPPAIPVFAETALAQHKAHLAAFNSVLTAGGLKAITAPDPALTPTVKSDFAKVTDVTGLAELALLLENVAAQSYQDDIASLASTHARATSASILPVEMTHAAILYFVLGKYPGIQSSSGTPLAFNPLSLNRPNSDISVT
ncbi:MAG: ferritin-like domain-containing protein [Acidimicrobiales bacterium]